MGASRQINRPPSQSDSTINLRKGDKMTFLNRIAGAVALGMALLLGSGLVSSPAQAYILTLKEVGNDVVATGNGALDLTGLNSVGESTVGAYISPIIAGIVTGPADLTPFRRYSGFTGSTSFGSGGFTPASSGSGDIVGIDGGEGDLQVPGAYVSGSFLSSSTTWPR
jgi:hypothetical protein